MNRRLSVPYRNILGYRILLSLFAAVAIVLFGAPVSFFMALTMKAFYLSVGGSFIIAFALINMVHIAVKMLDKRYSWKEAKMSRAVLQICFGVVVPGIVAFLLAALYFAAFGIDIHKTAYLKWEYPIIVGWVILLNVYYLIDYVYLTKFTPLNGDSISYSKPLKTFGTLRTKQEVAENEYIETNVQQKIDPLALNIDTTMDNTTIDGENSRYIWVEYNGTHIRLDATSEICFLHSENSITNVYANNGLRYPLKSSLTHYQNIYHAGHYFLINRATLINSNVIKGFKRGINRTLILVLELPFEMKGQDADFITVSRDKVKDFKAWFLK